MDIIPAYSSIKGHKMSVVNQKPQAMNALEYHKAVVNRDYVNNPEKAEEMYKWANSFVKEALDGQDSREMSLDKFTRAIAMYFYKQGVKTVEMSKDILEWTAISWINKNLRVEFDEEYVEYFM